MRIRLNVVNKYEYENEYEYREVIMIIPSNKEKFEKDFKYLDLNYNNHLSIRDTHITDIEIIDCDNEKFSKDITEKMKEINESSAADGYTMPFNDVKRFYDLIKDLSDEEKTKLLAIIDAEREQIRHIKDVIMFVELLEDYVLDSKINSNVEYATKLIESGDVSLNDIIEYIDLEKIGEAYTYDENVNLTDYGLLEMTNYAEHFDKLHEKKDKEEEEEFE